MLTKNNIYIEHVDVMWCEVLGGPVKDQQLDISGCTGGLLQ